MKLQGKSLLIAVFSVGFVLFGTGTKSFGDTEIDMDDLNKPTPVPAPKAVPTAIPTPAPDSAAANPTPASQEIEVQDETESSQQTAPQPTPTVFEVQGHVKMRDLYEAGKTSYQQQDYDQAIRYWTKAVAMKDPDTPKLYYAEANAMLGIIYQYHIIHLGRAYRYYKAALHYEHRNATALRHIKQVYKYRNRKD